MKNEPFNKDINELIQEALDSSTEFEVPRHLTESTIHRLERKLILQQLINEFLLKAGIIIASLLVLGLVFFLFRGTEILAQFLGLIENYITWILPALFLIIFTIIVDQVGLKYFTRIEHARKSSVPG